MKRFSVVLCAMFFLVFGFAGVAWAYKYSVEDVDFCFDPDLATTQKEDAAFPLKFIPDPGNGFVTDDLLAYGDTSGPFKIADVSALTPVNSNNLSANQEDFYNIYAVVDFIEPDIASPIIHGQVFTFSSPLVLENLALPEPWNQIPLPGSSTSLDFTTDQLNTIKAYVSTLNISPQVFNDLAGLLGLDILPLTDSQRGQLLDLLRGLYPELNPTANLPVEQVNELLDNFFQGYLVAWNDDLVLEEILGPDGMEIGPSPLRVNGGNAPDFLIDIDDILVWGVLGLNFSIPNPIQATITRVPEPSTILLISCGLFGLVGYSRRKRFKK